MGGKKSSFGVVLHEAVSFCYIVNNSQISEGGAYVYVEINHY